MIETSGGKKSSSFSCWLRTGKLPPALSPDGLEFKFNPWHDPVDGRFTFTGAGQRYAANGTNTTDGASGRVSARSGRAPNMQDHINSRTATLPKADAPRVGPLATDRRKSVERPSIEVQPKRVPAPRPANEPSPVAEFVGGVGEGLYDVGKETVAGVHAALTTNPATAVRNASRGVAGMIDAAIAGEDTPALIQVSRVANAVANASARDIGRATGTVVGNVALAAAPGAALSKTAALRQLRMARPRTTYEPPQIG
jgi:hypothetical protein